MFKVSIKDTRTTPVASRIMNVRSDNHITLSAKHFKNFSRKYAMHLIEMDEIKNHHIYALYLLRY